MEQETKEQLLPSSTLVDALDHLNQLLGMRDAVHAQRTGMAPGRSA